VKPFGSFVEMPSSLLLAHHSMGHTAFEDLMNLGVPMATVFHSITPAKFFEDAGVRTHIRLGFNQLHRLAARSSFGIAVSNHNRQQMYDAGFRTVEVMPVRVDFSDHRRARDQRTGDSNDWLFVGRIVPNKRQMEVVRAHAIHRRAGGSGHLHLVGDTSFGPYVDQVRAEIDRLGVGRHVTLHGKVSDEELIVRYSDAGFFVCLSEHEGFGVPLLEAMAAGIPVIARDAAAIAETLGGAGVLLRDADPVTAAAAVRVVEADPVLRAAIVADQDARLARLEGFDVEDFLDRIVSRAAGHRGGTTLQVQGPFETSYSLAILNREVALALDEFCDLDVSLYATEGPGDYTPAPSDLAAHPSATRLYDKRHAAPYPEIAIRQMFPPRVDDSTAGMTFQYFGWEESRIPSNVVADFNQHLAGIGTMSNYVKRVLRESGVTVPIEVVGVGVHEPDPGARCSAPELESVRATRFLHISSAFPRKGVDVLLRGFFESFDDTDDVTLLLKTFPNPHNEVDALLESLRSEFPDAPHVCWIDRDMDRDEIDGLYGLASAYVHTARGEGFGLPVAEAMLAGIPVISVAATGLADFVCDSTAAVIGHETAPARTHLSVPGSEWTEPSLDDLKRELSSFARGENAERRRERVETARALIRSEFKWADVARRWRDFVAARRKARNGISVAAVTTFNSRCGIAEYAGLLYEQLDGRVNVEIFADDNAVPVSDEREASVRRIWTNDRTSTVDRLLAELRLSTAEVLHIQYNFGFFTVAELGRLIAAEVPLRPVIVTIHRTVALEVDEGFESMADIADELRSADAVIVHQESDRRRLDESGVADNVHVIPIGTESPVPIDRTAARRRLGIPDHAFVVGTFGFLLPHKGLIPLVRAVAELRSIGVDAWLVATCALHPDPSSAAHRAAVVEEIHRLELDDVVHLATDFLERVDALGRLGAADVLVLPYEETNESASAAIRFVLPLGRAIVTSRLQIFEDVADIVPMLEAPVDPFELARLLEELWLDEVRLEGIARDVATFSDATSWARASSRTREVYAEVLRRRATDGPCAGGESRATKASVV
jgi:glycosyltransferase involved in cell wall biosynthesis